MLTTATRSMKLAHHIYNKIDILASSMFLRIEDKKHHVNIIYRCNKERFHRLGLFSLGGGN